jgi:hypothetical protein
VEGQDRVTDDLRYDWAAYWENFKEKHGGTPVEVGGRLLFHDGWAYSKDDFAGPEWPPPRSKEALKKLQLAYWRRRLELVRDARDELRGMVRNVRETAQGRSADLAFRDMETWDPAGGKMVRSKTPKDWADRMERGRLEILERDCVECARKVKELTSAEDETERRIAG